MLRKHLAGIACFLVLLPPVAAAAPGPGVDQPDAPLLSAAAHPEVGEPAHFRGEISLPGTKLPFSIRLVIGLDGSVSGSIDIPLQGVEGHALRDVEWTAERLAFVMALPGQPGAAWPRFEYELSGDGPAASGTLRQAGMEFDATLERLAGPPEGPRRPQVPTGPLPYEARDVEFENRAGGLTIAGTLVIPEGDGPFPCAVLITGSGPQDRDETLFDHKPFLVLADHLARHGIATLRCDDRGVGGTGPGAAAQPDSLDLATDVAAMVEFVLTREEIDPGRVGLIGHSEGALTGPIVAADDGRVSFLVMLAGPGVPGDEILIRQGDELARAAGATEDTVAAQRPWRERLFAAVIDGDMEGAREAVEEILKLSSPELAESEVRETLDRAVEGQLEALGSKWLRTFLTHDPRAALREVDCPVLVLNGDLDKQVLHDQNVPEVERALREGGNENVTVHVLPGLNHLFQPAKTGGMMEYGQIETTFDEGALRIIREWIETVTRR